MWMVEARELTVQVQREGVVSQFRLTDGLATENSVGLAVLSDDDRQLAVDAMHALPAAIILADAALVAKVLGVRADAQVGTAVVPNVAIDVVDDHALSSLTDDGVVEERDRTLAFGICLRGAGSGPLMLAGIVRAVVGIPPETRKAFVILIITEDGEALCGGDRPHAAFAFAGGVHGCFSAISVSASPDISATVE